MLGRCARVDPGPATGVRDGRGPAQLHPPRRSAGNSRPHPRAALCAGDECASSTPRTSGGSWRRGRTARPRALYIQRILSRRARQRALLRSRRLLPAVTSSAAAPTATWWSPVGSKTSSAVPAKPSPRHDLEEQLLATRGSGRPRRSRYPIPTSAKRSAPQSFSRSPDRACGAECLPRQRGVAAHIRPDMLVPMAAPPARRSARSTRGSMAGRQLSPTARRLEIQPGEHDPARVVLLACGAQLG